MARRYFVYLLASKPRGTLYVGVTNHLTRRVFEHRLGTAPGFTRRYHVHRLVWFETVRASAPGAPLGARSGRQPFVIKEKPSGIPMRCH